MGGGTVVLETVHFGVIDVDEEQIITIEGGLAPFSSLTRYVLLEREDEAPFVWLQSAEAPALTFVCAPMWALAPDHANRVWVDGKLEGFVQESTEMLSMLTLAENLYTVTVNLLAPVVFDRRKRLGRQVILDGEVSLCRTPLRELLQGCEPVGTALGDLSPISGPRGE